MAALLAAPWTAQAERVWLVVGASDENPADIAAKANRLVSQNPDGLVVKMGDCGGKQNIWAWVAEITDSRDTALAALSRLKTSIKDAYIKPCDKVKGSLLDLGISAVDPSIGSIPKDAVNWGNEDRISTALPLGDGRTLAIIRYYERVSNDPLEGRRERVLLVAGDGNRKFLVDNCIQPEHIGVNSDRITFDCVREEAGTELLHSSLVFDPRGNKLKEIEHCRNPEWSNKGEIRCELESVDSDGKLRLEKKGFQVD